MTQAKLSSIEWIEAAFRALSTSGPQAIKAEAIARELGVSKGSFYWHFTNVADLKTKMLTHWYEAATQEIIAQVNQVEGSPAERLSTLVDIATGNKSEPYGGVSVEAAIRDWGKYSDEAGEMVKRVDTQRLNYLTEQLMAAGFDENAARASAEILYAGLIGLEILAIEDLANLRSGMHQLLQKILN
jgi:AcrR family transcriptional regulator